GRSSAAGGVGPGVLGPGSTGAPGGSDDGPEPPPPLHAATSKPSIDTIIGSALVIPGSCRPQDTGILSTFTTREANRDAKSRESEPDTDLEDRLERTILPKLLPTAVRVIRSRTESGPKSPRKCPA